MNAEIISVGTELMMGDITNTDAQYLARQLLSMGIRVNYQTTIDDNPTRLKKALMQAVQRSQLILFTGGLGPTPDDLTKETVCEAIGYPLEEDAESLRRMQEYFQRIGREMTENNYKQIRMPKGSTIFPNDFGTAPGCAIEAGDQCIILLPGPPRELKPMFDNYVTGFLDRFIDAVVCSHTINLFGIGESQVAYQLGDMLKQEQPVVATYAKDGEVQVKVTTTGQNSKECEDLCLATVREICLTFADYVYGVDEKNLESAVVKALKTKGSRLAVAESCTAGLLAKRITDVPGASAVFDCGVVTYSNQMKKALLGVDDALLRKNGAVSEPVAKNMALCVRRIGSADLGVGITGIAGPEGGTPEKPVGLVYVSLTDGYTVWVRKLTLGHERDRDYIRYVASSHALDMVRLYLENSADFMALGTKLTKTELSFAGYSAGAVAAAAGAAALSAPTAPTQALKTATAEGGEDTADSDGWDVDNIMMLNGEEEEEPEEQTDGEEAEQEKLPWYKRFVRSVFPCKGDSKANVIRKIILLLLALAIVACVAYIVNYYVDTAKHNALEGDLKELVGQAADGVPAEIAPRFGALWSANNDFKGWLTLPGTKTDNPVVQYTDNDYYLKKDFQKEDNRYGTLYIDAGNRLTPTEMSRNITIYGHNMKDGSMLGDAQQKYRKLTFYKSNPVLTFSTAYSQEDMHWKIFSVMITNSKPAQDNGFVFDYRRTNFANDADFLQFIADCKERSMFILPVDVQPDDHILTLSTCSYEFSDARLVIMARLVRDGESTAVDVEASKLNPNPLYPQAWYDKYKKEKPASKAAASSKAASSAAPVSSAQTSSANTSTATSSASDTSSRPSSSAPPVSSGASSSQAPSSSSESPPSSTSSPPVDSSSGENSSSSEVSSAESSSPSEPSSAPEPPSSQEEPPPVESIIVDD